ncbi:DegT/DnrJ/EryC1/StrS family aminotransferase [Streptomyces sp. NPDC021012]|uniref:DegT/DnrJ/EryC1/StrS family aminotransferase n=1 Tax=Streptomyces sp. NPDC021012 TaxID=3365107 RepID=UPI003794DB29
MNHTTQSATTMRATALGRMAELLDRSPAPVGDEHARAFEAELADRFGTAHAVALSSGTAALHTALAAYGIGAGDEVLVPGACVVMTLVAIRLTGAVPVLVDSAAGELDFDDLAGKTNPRTKAVLPVHLAGRCADLARLTAYCADRGLRLIEDACQAEGTRYDGRWAGTFGDAGCFSTKDGKLLWSGEGGYILTDDAGFAARARSFATHGFLPAPGQPAGSRLGHNYRMPEPVAIIARGNLARFDELLALRRRQTRHLLDAVAHVPGLTPIPPDARLDWNGYAPLLRVELERPREFCARLAEQGVANSVGTYGLTTADRLPSLQSLGLTACPAARADLDTALAVVVHEGDTEARLDEMARIITEEACQWR